MSTTELQQLEGAVITTAPSGTLEIQFQSKPRRQYMLRDLSVPIGEGDVPTWIEVPSVSEILNILDKPGLPWWGMKVGVDGLNELVKRGKVAFAQGPDGLFPVVDKGGAWDAATNQEIVDLLTLEKLTTNHVKDKAASRGGNVHDALELWGQTKMLPVSESYPEEERGYVEALRAFLLLTQGNIETRGLEVMVGSLEHRFAGRYDLDVFFEKPFEVARRVFPKKKPAFMTVQAGPWCIDLKTSKSVYNTHLLQLEAYEIARRESGHEPNVGLAVLHVMPDGRYEFVPSTLGPEAFLKLRTAYDAVQDAEQALKL